MYVLRSEAEFGGLVVAEFDNNTAGRMISEAKGHWETKKFVSGNIKNVFVFDADSDFGIDERGCRIAIKLWANSYLEPV